MAIIGTRAHREVVINCAGQRSAIDSGVIMLLARQIVPAVLLFVVGLLHGSDLGDSVRDWLIETYRDGARQAVIVKVGSILYKDATLVSAQKSEVQLYGKDLDGALPWALLGDEGICMLAENLIGKAPAPICKSWLMLAISCNRAKTPAFRRTRDNLFVEDAEAAGEIDAALASSSPSSADQAAPPADSTSAPDAPDATDGSVAADDLDDETGPMFDKKGKLNRAEYLRWAFDYSAVMMNTRLGPTAKDLQKESKSKSKSKSRSKDKASEGEDIPTIWAPPVQVYKPARNGLGMPYNVAGPPTKEGGDYSSTHAQILYAPDAKGDPGVDRISILDEAHNCFTYQPTPTWWGGWHPEPALSTPAWQAASPKGLGAPVGIARGYGAWCNSGIIAFTSGLLGTAGTCTSQNPGTFIKLPPGKIPTAITLTPRNEFALVTVWDVVNLKGEIAVVALECSYTEGLMALYSWHQPHPDLPNPGGFTSMKLLGFVDLPFATPTAISAAGNRSGTLPWLKVAGKNAFGGDIDLSKQDVRDSFASRSGENRDYIESSGFAVVISRFENKAAFIDLQPLFYHFFESYCSTQARWQQTREYGPGPEQWPCDFSVNDQPKPRVVKVVKIKNPTVVNVTVGAGDQARVHIATVEGLLQVWRVGGLASDAPVSPADIKQTGQMKIGRNPTCLVYAKNCGWGKPPTLSSQLIAVCRGDREIDWIEFAGDNGTIIRRLRDSRLVDPVYAEVADTHGTESHVISVTDFQGKQVINYRFGPVILHTNGGARFDMGPDGKAEFECGGAMAFPGYPYAVCGTNVN
jgi:hypothetical protein